MNLINDLHISNCLTCGHEKIGDDRGVSFQEIADVIEDHIEVL